MELGSCGSRTQDVAFEGPEAARADAWPPEGGGADAEQRGAALRQGRVTANHVVRKGLGAVGAVVALAASHRATATRGTRNNKYLEIIGVFRINALLHPQFCMVSVDDVCRPRTMI